MHKIGSTHRFIFSSASGNKPGPPSAQKFRGRLRCPSSSASPFTFSERWAQSLQPTPSVLGPWALPVRRYGTASSSKRTSCPTSPPRNLTPSSMVSEWPVSWAPRSQLREEMIGEVVGRAVFEAGVEIVWLQHWAGLGVVERDLLECTWKTCDNPTTIDCKSRIMEAALALLRRWPYAQLTTRQVHRLLGLAAEVDATIRPVRRCTILASANSSPRRAGSHFSERQLTTP